MTIEERAKKECNPMNLYNYPKIDEAIRNYIIGATSQRKIDIDKACKVFDRLMMDYEQDRKSHDECLAEMKQAMMED